MKKIIALILAAVLLAGLVSAQAEEPGKYELLKVGTTTPFSGNFLHEALGNNISDQDVRKMIHGYSLVYWNADTGSYQFNDSLVTGVSVSEDDQSYTLSLAQGLTYNDGTPITVRDYAFTLLLMASYELKRASGVQGDISRILGGREYQEGQKNELAGFRILDDYMMTVTVDPSYIPYFYQLKVLDIAPLPISVIAPNCKVRDDGEGVYISGPFSEEMLTETLLNPETGYMSHPSVTSGPYMLTAYDGNMVTLELNEAYIGDEDGTKPTIPKITVQAVDSNQLIDRLTAGEIDLAVRCTRKDQIQAGISLVGGGDHRMSAYSRAGLSYISFCAESGATADGRVRQAISMCLDKANFTDQYTGAYGTTVKGYYGIGQWMFLMVQRMASGSIETGGEGAEGEEEDLSDLTMDAVPEVEFDPEGARELLEEAGWNLNENGDPYDAEAGGTRYLKAGENLIPLKLKMIYPEENASLPILEQTFTPYLAQAGIELETEAKPMPDLLEMYYGHTTRDCDMILLGTNFGDVFDPSGEYDENGTSRLNGITDSGLREMAISMRSTEPGLSTEYCRRWLAYMARRATVIPEIPLYSDAYLDFHIAALQKYEPAVTGCWAVALQDAILSDYIPEEEAETEEPAELEEGEEIFD